MNELYTISIDQENEKYELTCKQHGFIEATDRHDEMKQIMKDHECDFSHFIKAGN